MYGISFEKFKNVEAAMADGLKLEDALKKNKMSSVTYYKVKKAGGANPARQPAKVITYGGALKGPGRKKLAKTVFAFYGNSTEILEVVRNLV